MPVIACSIAPTTEELVAPIPTSDEIDPDKPLSEKESNWMESVHETIANSVYQSAFWFDSFFINDECSQLTPKTNAKIRLGWRPKYHDLTGFETRFRLNVKLPHLRNRVDLIFSDDSEDDLDQLPLDSSDNPNQFTEERFSAAVRFVHKSETDKYTDSRLGISGGDLFVRARHRRLLSWGDAHGFQLEPSLYYFIKDGLGARLLLEYNYQLTDTSQFRMNYSIRGSNAFSGIRWKHGIYHLAQLADKRAAAFGLIVEGERNGDSGFVVDQYTLSYRYRFNAVQQWLFFEVEPFIEWTEAENYRTIPGIALRVEGYFYKD